MKPNSFRSLALVLAGAALAMGTGSAPVAAKGCLRGAAAGAVAGHLAHHHAIAGAAVGCVAMHHHYAKKMREHHG